MNWPSHVAYPYLFVFFLSKVFGFQVSLFHYLLLIVASMIPDFDYVIHWFYTKLTGRFFRLDVNHHEWPSHWPIVYSPFLLWFLLSPSVTSFVLFFGVYSHLLLDSVACLWGIRWLAPFSNRWFNYAVANLNHHKSALSWLKAWKSSRFRVAELVALSLVIIHLFFLL